MIDPKKYDTHDPENTPDLPNDWNGEYPGEFPDTEETDDRQ